MKPIQPNRTHTPKAALAAILLACGLLTTAAPAATDKSGVIEEETWTAAMSPIRIVGDITVYSLTIQPGVEVIFTGDFEFDCPGILKAQGEEDPDTIWFHGDTGITWKGINFLNSTPGTVMDYCIVQNSAANGIAITDSFPAISNCEIKNNSAALGAGVNVILNLNVSGTLVLSGCTFSNNTAVQGGGVAVQVISATAAVRFIDCQFSNNICSKTDGNAYGGGAWVRGNTELLRCYFKQNTAQGTESAPGGSSTGYGGGLWVESGNISILTSTFQSNAAVGSRSGSLNEGYAYGGGAYIKTGTVLVENSIVAGNTASGSNGSYGAGMYLANGIVNIDNCTFASNNKEGLYRSAGTVEIINSIIYLNNSNGTQVAGTATITYSDVQNGYAGTGNINVNPILDPVTYKINKFSSCVDAGNPDPAYNDLVFDPPAAWGSYGTARNDMGAHGGPGAALWEPGSGPPKVVSLTGAAVYGYGDAITIKVGVSGLGPFGYRWMKGGVTILADPRISGLGTDTLTLTGVIGTDAGDYTVEVTSAYGTVISGASTIVVEPIRVNLKMFAGLIIQAETGKTVKVEYSNDLSPGSWTTLTQFALPSSPYTYYDADSPNHPKRFYRAVEVP
jgi:hypothetical protein